MALRVAIDACPPTAAGVEAQASTTGLAHGGARQGVSVVPAVLSYCVGASIRLPGLGGLLKERIIEDCLVGSPRPPGAARQLHQMEAIVQGAMLVAAPCRANAACIRGVHGGDGPS